MATDSTELTFLRCPSCRSLVPAMSSACRMCGAPLDGAAREDEGEKGAQKSGRIRQRTMSEPSEDLNVAANKVREEAIPSAPPPPAAVIVSPPVKLDEVEEVELDDPLSAYIEEVEVAEEAQAAKASTTSSAKIPAPERPVARETLNGDSNKIPEASAEKPRVVIESGNRRGGRGLSFGANKGREETAHEAPRSEPVAEPIPERRAEVRNEARPTPPPPPPPARPGFQPREERRDDRREMKEDRHDERKEVRREERRDDRRDSRPDNHNHNQHRSDQQQARQGGDQPRTPRHEEPRREESRREEPRREEPRRDERRQENREVRKEEPRVAQRSAPQGVKRESDVPGMLYGWLVSYLESDGRALELREGKFFVTASSLKTTDLVLEDPSVSTPHSMVSVNRDRGLYVQDLMSERGVFLRPRGGDTYQRVSEGTEVGHGDWIRFGDVEFLVSLIAHVGEK